MDIFVLNSRHEMSLTDLWIFQSFSAASRLIFLILFCLCAGFMKRCRTGPFSVFQGHFLGMGPNGAKVTGAKLYSL